MIKDIEKIMFYLNLKKRPIRTSCGAAGKDGRKIKAEKINILRLFNFCFKKITNTILAPFILKDFFYYIKNDKEKRFSVNIKDLYPQIKDKTINTNFDTHYIYHTCWAARKVQEIKPIKHVDISSILYFSGIVSAFVPVDFYDYRPADLKLSNLLSKKVDLTNLPFESNSIESISCMHTVEHVGLGRYGDSINPRGGIESINELKRVVIKNGSFLFVVPVGKSKIEFNAHRIYSYEQVISYFAGFELKEFTLITDDGNYIGNANKNLVRQQKYGCGCFWFIKK